MARQTASPTQRFGAHMSIAGGLHNACTAGQDAGCDCLQVFVKNQRQWVAAPLTDEAVREWKRAVRRTGLRPIVAHGTYLINLASPDATNRKRSIDAHIDELTRCEALGIRYLVAHPGSHVGQGEAVGIRGIAGALDCIHQATAGFKVRTLLETTAGQGTNLGYRFEHLAEIIARVGAPERVDVCLDTCHLFAAGYDFRRPDGYQAMMADFDRLLGMRRIKCIHVNDSKQACGSRVDRHEHIGRGTLGTGGFRQILNDPRLAKVPKILETPKGEDDKGRDLDRVNLARLRRLIRR